MLQINFERQRPGGHGSCREKLGVNDELWPLSHLFLGWALAYLGVARIALIAFVEWHFLIVLRHVGVSRFRNGDRPCYIRILTNCICVVIR